MVKVVYCHKGQLNESSLSTEALDRMAELGYPMKLNPFYFPESSDGEFYCKYRFDHIVPRHHPILVQVIEELGNKSARIKRCTEYRIREVKGLYRIEVNDDIFSGPSFEKVMEPEDYDWVDPLQTLQNTESK